MYTTIEKVEAYLQRSLEPEELDIFDDINTSVADFIKSYTGRNWLDVGVTEEPEASIRYYDGNGLQEIFIDDFLTLTSLELLDSDGNIIDEIASAYYTLYPLNSTPKNSIRVRGYRFGLYSSGVKVTAVFSSGVVPKGVVVAATQLIGDMIERQKQTGAFKKESIEGYSYELLDEKELNEHQKGILTQLEKYRKIEF